MNKIISAISTVAAVGCLATVSYIVMKNKKNMVDILIEEIEKI